MVVRCGIQAQMMEVESPWCLLCQGPIVSRVRRRAPFTLPPCHLPNCVCGLRCTSAGTFVARAVRRYGLVILLVSGLTPGGLQLWYVVLTDT
jgi:hypothetical protein